MFKSLFLLLVTLTISFGNVNQNDLDNDLVPNNVDKCPNTPEGVFVTRDGCTQEIKRTVYFAHALADLDQENKIKLISMVEILLGAKGYTIHIVGHTDSIADGKTNMILSKRRAYAVKKFLLNSQIKEKDIVSVKWYGETRPVASNITSDGRSQNRRVEIILK